MYNTPKSNRLHISIFGKRNAGKSSLINALTNQSLSVVSEIPGTTTDPVSKSMELLPLGPIVLIDTAGLDDNGLLGELRIEKTLKVIEKTDLGVLVFDACSNDLKNELTWYADLEKKKIPTIGVINKIDLCNDNCKLIKSNFNIPFVEISAKEKINISGLKKLLIDNAPIDFEMPTILGDIVNPKDKVVLVAPQDIQAPKGRLILPQVQIIRDILDNDALALTVKDTELLDILDSLKDEPSLIITDSQMFRKVNELIPEHLKLTSFSILMARYKGDLDLFIKGAKVINSLKPNDKILIAESCTHHALKGDIAREKLPLLLEKKVGGKLNIVNITGVDFPDNLSEYKLIIHCGACMFTRRQLLSRLEHVKEQNIPITNFGVALAELNGILDRSCNFLLNSKS
ncbi:[FeFe] hydrogenase H-cluster maturation GTPase HydF [Clostridium butyricum]|jgi:[FeFe] hydrogenase H-cluster maturation GTPase HydF|uniref:[FeFe] hydrogenase H-cluster maturation GTPase HydF n=2 Tax=Bacteroides uniformis TaxID=820 RepID=A0A6I0JB66_BACUN|nr:[FeFe] hydrogenase H-cluster maturation GTPase HydF [Clostridium butyricum]KAB4108937.1 [FeFe] hydrogenase H-cluster maturation GTPase HydF [Bacteroides uniformis]MTM17344.1 [FeFe] hydrogenase H-cluster maturation GTPase HydF [Turicibacter sanguinis]ALP88728.1 [FeFe] hydrogenase H-cluster maturation GTPase HydF [Clostridium butyricum]ALS18333.1 [FeFe] hydrogenase H-cluster maturation GTPase HydF [Clostridium butyricum]ANF15458.1 [FeFe] hydrogenase H-cluster maturation GTPase HydF [Clostridi